jgi:hypothetical protein
MKKLLVLAAISATGYGVYHWHGHSQTEPERDNELVRDRIWIDHLPRNEREPIETLVILKKQAGGVFNTASRWQGKYEMFRYEMQGGQIRMDFPQTGERDRVRVWATKCNERGMDYCLKLQGNSRGVEQYYSREGWDVRSLDEARAKIDALEE